jgi:hypothetical protein
MSVVYFSLLLFVRIEQNVKIYNTLHLVFFTGYTYKIQSGRNNVFIHNFDAKCLWCYTIFMVTQLTVTPQKTGKYFQDKRKIISS